MMLRCSGVAISFVGERAVPRRAPQGSAGPRYVKAAARPVTLAVKRGSADFAALLFVAADQNQNTAKLRNGSLLQDLNLRRTHEPQAQQVAHFTGCVTGCSALFWCLSALRFILFS